MGQVFAFCWSVLSHQLIRRAKVCGTALIQPRQTQGNTKRFMDHEGRVLLVVVCIR